MNEHDHKPLTLEEARMILDLLEVWADKNFIEDTDRYGNPSPSTLLAEQRNIDRNAAFQIIDEAACPVYVPFHNYLSMRKTQLRSALKAYIRAEKAKAKAKKK